MGNLTIVTIYGNDTDDICPQPLLWTEAGAGSRKGRLITCIIGSIIHSAFWFQLVFCPSVRQKSMQWIYAYLITDIFLLARFFGTYIMRTTYRECNPSEAWILFVCFLETTVDNYLNILEVWILLALNICRYVQIVYNRNVYRVYKKTLIMTHVGIYVLSFLFVFFQFFFGWSELIQYVSDRCDVTYSNIPIQVFNIILSFALPIGLNVVVIYLSVRHIRSKSTLQQGQHHVSAREKYNRSLVIQFLVFYVIWVALWSPNVIVYQISISISGLTSVVRLLNFIEIALDPIIIAALDVRFWQAWRNLWVHIGNKLFPRLVNQGRIQPSTTHNVFSIKTPRLHTTAH